MDLKLIKVLILKKKRKKQEIKIIETICGNSFKNFGFKKK